MQPGSGRGHSGFGARFKGKKGLWAAVSSAHLPWHRDSCCRGKDGGEEGVAWQQEPTTGLLLHMLGCH